MLQHFVQSGASAEQRNANLYVPGPYISVSSACVYSVLPINEVLPNTTAIYQHQRSSSLSVPMKLLDFEATVTK